MSASTASPAANSPIPDSILRPSTRRRTPPVTRSRSHALGVLGDTATGRDTSNAVLERSRDLSDARRGSAALRRRRSAPRSEEPGRLAVVRVMFKIGLLLVGFLWLGQMIWKWGNLNGISGGSPIALLDYEGRISEVEKSFKKMTKMLQVQLEVVDKKIGVEIGNVARELKQVEAKSRVYEEELKKLVARADGLDSSLGELKDMDLLSKQEFESFLNKFKRSEDGGTKVLTLDDVRDFAREIVEKEMEKHAADGLGRVDYALASGGARVVRHSEPYRFGKIQNWFAAGKGRNGVHANAQKLLEPSFGEPGQCFALNGSTGFVEIKLRSRIIPEAITLEHVSKAVAYDRSTAPRDCRVSAWLEGHNDGPANGSEKKVVLSEFSYDLEKSNAQTFNVEMTDQDFVNMVRLDVLSNHGSSSLTCIYRFRVHGHEPSSDQGTTLLP